MKHLLICLVAAMATCNLAEMTVRQSTAQDIELVFKQLVADGYEAAKSESASRLREMKKENSESIQELQEELAATKAEGTGKFKVFKSNREKLLRESELEIRLHRLQQVEPNPKVSKWVYDYRMQDIANVTAIEAARLYMVRSIEIAQVTGRSEVHGIIKIRDGATPNGGDYTYQRVKIIWNAGTENLYEGKPLIAEATFFVCTGIETYEVARGGTNRIPVLKPCSDEWEKYVAVNVPAEDRRETYMFPEKDVKNQMREWKDTTGKFRVNAEFVSSTDTTVDLKKQDGSIITVKHAILSLPDNIYIEAMKLADLPFKTLRGR